MRCECQSLKYADKKKAEDKCKIKSKRANCEFSIKFDKFKEWDNNIEI